VAAVPLRLPTNVPAANVFWSGLTVNPIPIALVVKANTDPFETLVKVR
jgi:hypothetical protein